MVLRRLYLVLLGCALGGLSASCHSECDCIGQHGELDAGTDAATGGDAATPGSDAGPIDLRCPDAAPATGGRCAKALFCIYDGPPVCPSVSTQAECVDSAWLLHEVTTQCAGPDDAGADDAGR